MSDTIKEIVQKIKDSQSAKVKVTTTAKRQFTLDCVYKEDTPPHFHLVFSPNSIPDNLDLGKKHPVSITYKNSSITLGASIKGRKDDRTLEMIASETVDPAGMREYFRVNMTTPIEASYELKDPSKKKKNWSLSGTTQDLSGSGVLALFPEEPLNKHNIFLTIKLPESTTPVRVVGHVVRKRKLRRERWQVAFHFDVITDKHRDQVIQSCLREQRKQLRERIQTL